MNNLDNISSTIDFDFGDIELEDLESVEIDGAMSGTGCFSSLSSASTMSSAGSCAGCVNCYSSVGTAS